VVLPRYLTENDRTIDNVNPEYEAWEVEHQTLLVWLHSTLLKFVLSLVLGSNHSYEVWEKINECFGLQTNSCARQLRNVMRAVRLDSKTMERYLKIKKLR